MAFVAANRLATTSLMAFTSRFPFSTYHADACWCSLRFERFELAAGAAMLGVFPSNQEKINRVKNKSKLGVVVSKGEEGLSNKRLRRIRTAVLLPGSSAAGVARGENIADLLASRGFAIRTVKQPESLVQDIENILPATNASSVVVFDVDGRSGRDMAASCKSDARIAGLYSFRLATGMFQKVFGPEESPGWIDPALGSSSYEQILTDRGWSFLSEDESEPRFAFDLVDTGPWERAPREEREGGLSPLGYVIDRMTDEEVEEAAASLTFAQRNVLLEGGTDAPDNPRPSQQGSRPSASSRSPRGGAKAEGLYVCALGGLPLFASEDELASPPAPGGCARRSSWPGFRRPVHRDHVILREESGPQRRTEVLCARSGAHLGHVFDDGPPPTGERFCINRSALVMIPRGDPLPRESRPLCRPAEDLTSLGSLGEALRGIQLEAATFAGGCFWHVRDDFLAVPGVHEVLCGFCGRVEAVRVEFDPVVTSYLSLARRFFGMHDPTTGDRQGNDWGPQYQAALFPHTDSQARAAEEALAWAREELCALRRGVGARLPREPLDADDPAMAAAAASASRDRPPSICVKYDSSRRSSSSSSGGKGGIDELIVGRTREVTANAGEVPPLASWWEGEDIRTVVTPMPVEDFVPESSETANR